MMESIVKEYKCVQNIDEGDRVVVGSTEHILHEIASVADFGLEAAIQHEEADRFLQWKSFANFQRVYTLYISGFEGNLR